LAWVRDPGNASEATDHGGGIAGFDRHDGENDRQDRLAPPLSRDVLKFA
jgi:hypothetical protein